MLNQCPIFHAFERRLRLSMKSSFDPGTRQRFWGDMRPLAQKHATYKIKYKDGNNELFSQASLTQSYLQCSFCVISKHLFWRQVKKMRSHCLYTISEAFGKKNMGDWGIQTQSMKGKLNCRECKLCVFINLVPQWKDGLSLYKQNINFLLKMHPLNWPPPWRRMKQKKVTQHPYIKMLR